MNIPLIFWSILAVALLVGLPIVLIWTSVDYLRGRGSDRRSSGGIGVAMQEIDRLVGRPSVEHQVEAEQPLLKREDDSGGE